MKMKRTILAMTLAGALTVGVLSGCGTSGDTAQEGETKKFTYWMELNGGVSSALQSVGEVTMFKELEKKTGIHIDFIHPPAGQTAEQFSLLIASREFPDMISYNWLNYPGGPDKAINDNVIVELNDYMESDAPNFMSWAKQEMYAKGTKTDGGKYFGFPAINLGDARVFGGLCLRGDWLKELNLSVPETIEEWDTVLRAFKEQKGAKFPLTGDANNLTKLQNFCSAFDVGIRLYVDNGKVKYGPAEPGFKDFLTQMNKWYQDGILDADYPTNTQTILDEKMTNGESGAVFCYIGSGLGRYMGVMKDRDPNYELVAAPYPAVRKGEAPRFMEMEGDVVPPFLAITTACSDVDTAVKWIDYLYSDEGRMLLNFGVEGDTYNMVDGKPVYTDKILHNPEGYSIFEAMCQNFQAPYVVAGLKQDENYLSQYYEFPQQVDAFRFWAKDMKSASETRIPDLTPTLEESEEVATLSTEITTYVDEMILKFIQGTEPLSNYDTFLSTLQKLKLDRYLELQQAAYERYMSR